jgi:hypothetical protein
MKSYESSSAVTPVAAPVTRKKMTVEFSLITVLVVLAIIALVIYIVRTIR